jgi:hypothetical protein
VVRLQGKPGATTAKVQLAATSVEELTSKIVGVVGWGNSRKREDNWRTWLLSHVVRSWARPVGRQEGLPA